MLDAHDDREMACSLGSLEDVGVGIEPLRA